MPQLLCTGCKRKMQIEVSDFVNEDGRLDKNPTKLIGSAICRCGTGTGFEIEKDVVVYVSGKSVYGTLNVQLSNTVKTLYSEAELCLMNGAPNAAVAMCRASLESALKQAGFDKPNLGAQIDSAKDAGRLNDIEVGLAHGSRLITRDAIHRGDLINISDVPSIISATIRILNKLSLP